MFTTNSNGLSEYQVKLQDPVGELIAILDNFTYLQFTRSVNNVGTFTIDVPLTDNPAKNREIRRMFKKDGRIEIERSIQGGNLRLEGDTFYLIRRKQRVLNNRGEYVYRVSGVDANDILRRQITNVDPTLASTYITAVAADNALKDIFTSYFLTASGTGIDLSAYMQCQADLTAAPVQTRKFAAKNVLSTMQEICASSAANTTTPTYLAFDLFWDGTKLEFRTYTGQRGQDRRQSAGNPLVVGPDFGNMADYEGDEDYTNEVTHVYGGMTGTASDTTRSGAGPFARVAKYYSTQGNSTAEQNTEAASQLRLGRPRYIHKGKLSETPGFRYGLQFGYGDYLTTQFDEISADCRLDAITITVEDGKETVEGIFRDDQ